MQEETKQERIKVNKSGKMLPGPNKIEGQTNMSVFATSIYRASGSTSTRTVLFNKFLDAGLLAEHLRERFSKWIKSEGFLEDIKICQTEFSLGPSE